MNIKMLKSAFVGLVLSVSGFANAGLITLNGSIDAHTEVDHWSFSVTSSGTFIFDVLAREAGNDFFANGVSNDQLDSYIYLFANDGNGVFKGSDITELSGADLDMISGGAMWTQVVDHGQMYSQTVHYQGT